MNLFEVLMLKYPKADFTRDILLADYGDGPVIQKWNLAGVKQPSDSEIEQFKLDLADEYAAKRLKEIRQAEYVKAGADVHSLIVALWEKVMENDSTAANALQVKRVKVKQDNV